MPQTKLPSHLLVLNNFPAQRESYHIVREVYNTRPATTTVRIRPGASPKTEYEYGKDMIAKQIYSENNKAAVCMTTCISRSGDIIMASKGVGVFVVKATEAHCP